MPDKQENESALAKPDIRITRATAYSNPKDSTKSKSRRSAFVGWLRHLVSGDVDKWYPLRLWLHILIALAAALLAPFVLWDRLAGMFEYPLSNEIRIQIVRVILYIIAGAGGVVALVIAYRRQGLNEDSHKRDQTKAFNERFAGASEQLASEQAASQLAGAYSMASLADDWDDGRQTCINVLCAFIRMPYDPPKEHPVLETIDDRKEHRVRLEQQQVRRAVMNLIGERLRADPVSGKTWHSHKFDFSGSVLDGADFTGIKMVDTYLNFKKATFTRGDFGFAESEVHSGELDFSSARFVSGWVEFIDVQFAGGIISFTGTKFVGGDIDFAGAHLCGSQFGFTGTRFDGSNIDFNEAQFTKSSVYFEFATFFGGNLDFRRATFSGGQVFFTESHFQGSHVDFSKSHFTGGTVKFQRISTWEKPPIFASYEDGLPAGLILPSTKELG
jgi:uncharacterized protein YjbI with pentapeptide repeats